MPLIGIIIVSEVKGFLSAIYWGNACKIGSYSVFILILGKYFFHFDGDDSASLITEADGSNLGVRIGT